MDCRQITFCSQKSKINPLQLQSLFNDGAFWARERQVEDLEQMLAHSHAIATCWDGEFLIGFARALSDGIYRATIWDVVIHPDYQGLGLGRKLVETLLSHALISRVERVYLMTTYQQGFYQQIGFQENQSTTMVLLNSAELQPISLQSLNSEVQETVKEPFPLNV